MSGAVRARNAAIRWAGIDGATAAFALRMREAGQLPGSEYAATCDWFHTLREAGLPTGLDADFEAPELAAHLEKQIRHSAYAAADKPRLCHIQDLRRGLKIYEYAFAEGARRRPVPPIALRQRRRFAVPHAEIRARLPKKDQVALTQIEAIARTLARLQWEGKGGPAFLGSDGHTRHTTISVSTAKREIDAVSAFLQHAHRKGWSPFTLKSLLTPERICDFLYYGESFNGALRTARTVRGLAFCLLDFFYRGRVHHPDPVVVISEAAQRAIEARMALERTRTHLHQLRAANESNAGESKWFPTLEQVEWAVAGLEEKLARAEERYARGALSAHGHWRAMRDGTLALVTLFCMARADTASTIELSRLARDGAGGILTLGGSAIVREIVRAKTHNRRYYPFVPEFILPANVLPHIRRLLAIEGRSLEAPLRAGERPVRLSAAQGDCWGRSRIPSGEFEVVPLFRLRPDEPRAVSYGQVRRILERSLTELRFGSTNPHTFRATGAIYWTFVRGMPEEHVMNLGLWDSPHEMRESYVKISAQDRMRLMASFIPQVGGSAPAKGERERAAAEAIGALTQLLAAPADAQQTERTLARVKAHAETIERTVASERGLQWEPATLDRFRPGEVERIDDALRGQGYAAGLKSVLGRDFFPSDALQSAARQSALSATPAAHQTAEHHARRPHGSRTAHLTEDRLIEWNAQSTSLAQLNSRYPQPLVDAARTYARGHRLSMKVLLAAALAEYLAKRADPAADPAPQLHYRRGRPTAELLAYGAMLMRVDHRGRKIRVPDGERGQGQRRRNARMALNSGDGTRPRTAPDHTVALRPFGPRTARVRASDGQASSLAL